VVPGDNYRAKALVLLARADTGIEPSLRAELENLAAAFLRLAEQAVRNRQFNLANEPPPKFDDPKLGP
jgi:hypothetical protein